MIFGLVKALEFKKDIAVFEGKHHINDVPLKRSPFYRFVLKMTGDNKKIIDEAGNHLNN
ncbi:hypothetical protein [Flavobacterium sp. ACAM 123]|uniref:hypothetical protein n=1 Tax=Flavobacterium sp. ACAM 123 TaxID=1189620 RepID=UPI0002F9325B|nr:hypothetical protein [Flavobacterium sp. ACAM 123]